MRAIVKLFTGLFMGAAMVLVAGAIVEPLVRIVAEDPAVSDIGLSTTALDLQQVLLQWMPLLLVAFLIVFGVMWSIRRGRTTEVRRR